MKRWQLVALLVAALYLVAPTMKLKAGVVLDGLTPEMRRGLDVIDRVHRQVTGHEVTITSGLDGTHMAASKHYEGNAVDIRTRDLAGATVIALTHALVNALGPAFDVVKESDHIHIEYDPS